MNDILTYLMVTGFIGNENVSDNTDPQINNLDTEFIDCNACRRRFASCLFVGRTKAKHVVTIAFEI